jgi:hypothetical protein
MFMEDKLTIQGRMLFPEDITEIVTLIDENPDWSRWKLSNHLSEKWDWRNARGQLKDMACRSLLLKLEQSGHIKLPPRRRVSPNRMNKKVIQPVLHSTNPIECELKALRPLEIINISQTSDYKLLFDFFLFKYHYLSYKASVGENLKYVIMDRFHRTLACVLFGASAWKVECRDNYIGWDNEVRECNINLITNNMRFLILPWIGVKHLASHILAEVSRRIRSDYQNKYGHPVYLLETFVEQEKFKGTCYRAANWIHVGETKGRTRNDRYKKIKVPVKDVYLLPLIKNFRDYLRQHNPHHGRN